MVRSVEPSVSHKRLEGFLSLSFSSNAPSAIFFIRLQGDCTNAAEDRFLSSPRTRVCCH